MDRCPHCPVGPDSECQSRYHPWLCIIRDPGDPRHNPKYRAPLPVERGPRGPEPEASTFVDLSWAMHSCGFRSPSDDHCPDRAAWCSLGGPRVLVSREECFACPECLALAGLRPGG